MVFSEDIPTHARLVHAGPSGHYDVETGEKNALEKMIDFQIAAKKTGQESPYNGVVV